jgi:hypothetical protein
MRRGRGSIVKRGKHYSLVIDDGVDENGKRIRKWIAVKGVKGMQRSNLRITYTKKIQGYL